MPRLLPTLGFLAAVLFAGTGCSRTTAPTGVTADEPLVVEAAPVEFSTEPVPIEVPGVLSRRTEASLSFKTGGVIAGISVRTGDPVRAGQVLATLRLDEIDATVSQARTAVAKARRDADRAAALQADHVATLENLQDARSGLELAEAGLRAAEFNRLHSVITAPADGRILRRQAEPDEFAASGRAILAFAADGDGWLVRAGVPEHEVVRLQTGDRASLWLDGGGEVAAVITQIAGAADPPTRTVEVELQPAADLAPEQRSGFLVNTRLWPRPVAARPAVPLAALVEGRDLHAGLFFLSADGRTVHRRTVEIEAVHGATAYLRTALPAGSRVVTTGAEFLTDGRAVRLP
ncbi:MAG: efflux RND transporter periplasmic adaptor subunit [Opitutales bacterium]